MEMGPGDVVGYLLPKDRDPWWLILIKVVVLIAVVVVVLVRAIDYVHAGEKAIVTRFGAVRHHKRAKPPHAAGDRIWRKLPFRYRKVYRGHQAGDKIVRYPGFTLLNPVSDKNRKGPDAIMPIELSVQTRKGPDGFFYDEAPWVNCWIEDLELALVDNQDWAIQFGMVCDEIYRIMMQEGKSIAEITQTLLDHPKVEAARKRLGIKTFEMFVRTANPSANFILREARPAESEPIPVPADVPKANGHIKGADHGVPVRQLANT
jgi:hypothetical protein